MNTELARALNGAILDLKKALDRLDGDVLMNHESVRLDDAFILIEDALTLLSDEQKEIEND